jgi:hypothetical protein
MNSCCTSKHPIWPQRTGSPGHHWAWRTQCTCSTRSEAAAGPSKYARIAAGQFQMDRFRRIRAPDVAITGS